jgi:carbonic anhydrase/acetyltransferase-like protein (isoleucine patch superfamily)
MDSFENLQVQLDTYLRKQPVLGQGVYIATGAIVVGDVTLGDGASVWYNAVLRGDINRIVVGTATNIQDNSVLHLADDYPCLLGSYVTVGHSAIVHACTVGDECLIGMGAVVLDGVELGPQCLVGARALITQHTKIPEGSLVLGSPAKVIRPLSQDERSKLKYWARKYAANAAYCLENKINVSATTRS